MGVFRFVYSGLVRFCVRCFLFLGEVRALGRDIGFICLII